MSMSTHRNLSSLPQGLSDLKIDLGTGCDAVLALLGEQLDNGNCNSIVRVDIGYFHSHHLGGGVAFHRPLALRGAAAGLNENEQLSNAELMLVFQGIVCCLPNMKTLVVMSYFRDNAMTLPAGALEMIFRRAIRLEILFLHQIQLHGTSHEYQEMAESLTKHTSLKRVNLHCCGTSSATATATVNETENETTTSTAGAPPPTTTTTSLDALVCALATLPTMYYLSLDQVPLSQVSMEALSNATSLKDLSFYSMPEIKPCLPILLNALCGDKQSTSASESSRMDSRSQLRGLRIRSCQLGPQEGMLMSQMLETNSSLESLVFFVDSDWQGYGVPLASALARNTSLKRLEVGIGKSRHNTTVHNTTISSIHSNGSATVTTTDVANTIVSLGGGSSSARDRAETSSNTNGDDMKQAHPDHHKKAACDIAKALKVNTSSPLRHLCLSLAQAECHELYNAFMEPFADMLETNYSLESLLLQGNNTYSVMSPHVAFLLSLNQRSILDRRQLFSDIIQQDNSSKSFGAKKKNPWMESLVRHKDDVNIINYLLSRNPNLIAAVATTTRA